MWTGRQKLVWQCRGASWAGRCCPVTRTLFQAAEWPGPSCPPPLPGPQNRPPSAGLAENIDRSNPTTHHAHCNTQKYRHHHKWDPIWVVSGPEKANLKKENKKTNIPSIFHRFRKTWINDDRIITPGWTIAFALHIISLPTRSRDWDFKKMSSVIFLSYNLTIGSKRTQYTNARRMRSECFMHSAFRASITLIKQQPRGMCALMTRYWTRRDVDHFEVSFAFKQHIKTVMETRNEQATVQKSPNNVMHTTTAQWYLFSKNSSKNVLDNIIIQLII